MKYKIYYQNEPRFNGVFSRNNLPKIIKDGAYVINFDEYADVVHIGLLYFVTEMKLFISIISVLKKLKNLLGIKTWKLTFFEYKQTFCIGFIDFMLAGKKLTDYTSLFSPHDFKKNDDIILSYFKNEWK